MLVRIIITVTKIDFVCTLHIIMLHTPENSESFSYHIQNRGNEDHGMSDGGRGMQFLTYHRIASRYPKYIHTYVYTYTHLYECLYGTRFIVLICILLANII